MKRRPPASPGGPQVSANKKARIAQLQQHAGVKDQERKGQRSQQPANLNSTESSQPDEALGQPPYHQLDASISAGQLQRIWQDGLKSLPFSATDTLTANQPAISRGRASLTKNVNNQAARSGRALEQLTDMLIATNPAMAMKAADAKAAAGLRVCDRSILLDNPPRAPPPAVQPSPEYAKMLRSPRHQGTPGCNLLPRKTITYAQLQPVHKAWQQYITDLVSCVSQQPSSYVPALSGTLKEEAVIMRASLQADLHGCLMEVQQCSNPRVVGCKGIVANITARTLQLVDEQDRVHAEILCSQQLLPTGNNVKTTQTGWCQCLMPVTCRTLVQWSPCKEHMPVVSYPLVEQ